MNEHNKEGKTNLVYKSVIKGEVFLDISRTYYRLPILATANDKYVANVLNRPLERRRNLAGIVLYSHRQRDVFTQARTILYSHRLGWFLPIDSLTYSHRQGLFYTPTGRGMYSHRQGRNCDVIQLSGRNCDVIRLFGRNYEVIQLSRRNCNVIRLFRRNFDVIRLSVRNREVIRLSERNYDVTQLSEKN
ncbi:hypothetical protein LguiA_030435 [Lonicera macranthoides]